MPSLLIIEPHWQGHNMRYVAWISREATRRGYDVQLATSEAFFEHSLYQEIRAGCEGRLHEVPIPGQSGTPFSGRFGYKFYYHRVFAELYRRLEKQGELPDFVIVPYLDYCVNAAGLIGSPFGETPWTGILINPDFHLAKLGLKVPSSYSQKIKERLFFRFLRLDSLTSVFTFDELLIRYVRQRSPELAKKIRYLPEPVELGGCESGERARRELSLSPEQTVILVYGVIDDSKGLDLLLRGFEREEFPSDVSLLVAGPQNQETKTLLSSPFARELRGANRLYERDEFLFGPGEHAVFLASDIVWVGYRNQYISSGVLLQAGMAGLPVIACDEGVIAHLTGTHDLGLIIDPDDPVEVANAVSKLTSDEPLASRLAKNGKNNSQQHTTERFSHAVGDELIRCFPLAT